VERTRFFEVMSSFPTGVAVVATIAADGTPRGLSSNAVCSVSAEPPLLLVCVDRTSRTLAALRHRRRFVVSFLRAGTEEVARLFASKADDKFERVAWRPAGNGMPWLHEDALGHAECEVQREVEAGDHVVFVARVVDGSPPRDGDDPLVYFRRRYSRWHAP
jgi:flavin reductase (DIM6/NTAB) family NADH-FMN oxidoreductase RutF